MVIVVVVVVAAAAIVAVIVIVVCCSPLIYQFHLVNNDVIWYETPMKKRTVMTKMKRKKEKNAQKALT